MMSKLFEPLTIREVTFKNRIVVSPMCEYSSEDGFANDWHLVHLGSRAIGGAALIITEAAAVSPEGRITPADLGLWKDEHIVFLNRIVAFIENHGSVAGIQLAHAGRKASRLEPWKNDERATSELGGWQIVGPSAVAFDNYEVPKELSLQGINKVVHDFVEATIRAIRAGFKVVEIHAAHGYLIHEFLSPYSNKRADNYGGSFENRIRILVEIVEAVKKVWPAEYPLFVRISATDWVEDGWTVHDSIALSKVLKTLGVDLIDCSTGGNVPAVKIPLTPGYQVEFAEAIKRESGIMTGTVGLITEAEQAEEIIASGKADLVLLAREFLRDPYFPLHAAQQLGVDIEWPVQYRRAKVKRPA
jgi:2,4-dienoyl-CoA reductase-like NADH-dependent reductase (Old Yellow Enzyme family)